MRSTLLRQSSRFLRTTSVRSYVVPMKELNFLIKDVLKTPEHYTALGFEGCGEDTIDMVLTETAKFSEEILAPLNATADEEGCKHLGPHTVLTPKGFKEAYTQYCDGGWQGLSFPEEYGGQGLPHSMAIIQGEISATANFAWTMYPGLSKGAINTILAHGDEALKNKYLTRMVSGEFSGTMCLTEPQCGSDLNQVSTRAESIGNGKYKINGTKIFISCGEHDLTNNIVHCVLARLPGAPEGTKGISLFTVPKHKVSLEGEISAEFNGVNIGRIEHKMGCHGSATCEINFEDAEGELIGTENKGMNHMFTFINTSRIGTSMQGVAAAELSFQNALWYTKERRAFRALNGTQDPSAAADPIIVHPDIRKMLLTQKAVAEGGRAMIYRCALLADKMVHAEKNGDKKTFDKIENQLGFMTPILKGFLTERGIEAANIGIQLYGGHGYIKSNKQEQVLRDVRISAIWEGTTGIQALDLLGRKIFARGANLAPIKDHCSDLRARMSTLKSSGSSEAVRKHAKTLYWKAWEWECMTYLIGYRAKKDKNAVGSASVDFLVYSGYISLAEQWLEMEETAAKMLKENKGEADFLDSKIKTSAFVFDTILPRTLSLRYTITNDANSIMALKPSQFSFDHAL